jgi:hypothetical protein
MHRLLLLGALPRLNNMLLFAAVQHEVLASFGAAAQLRLLP